MKLTALLLVSLMVGCRVTLAAQTATKDVASDPRLKWFDKDGDGKISDSERAAIRELMRKRAQQPGAMTPSGKTETVGNREVTEMEYVSSDGRKIPCVLSMPKGDGPFPCVVTIHGGSGNRDLAYIRTLAAPNPVSPTVNALNEQPWAVLAISYRAGALFGKEQDDVIAGIRFAKTLPKIDPARIGVMGGSHGGHLALIAAERMGTEFLCVVAGSPWMTNPEVLMFPKPNEPPLSVLPDKVRAALLEHGKRFYTGLTRGRGMSDAQVKEFIRQQSIEANADKIIIPSLFLTSLGDEAVPHVLVEPTIKRLQAAGRDVTVFVATNCPHGFYWGRDVGGARIGRGPKSEVELAEEKAAREQIIAFFTKQFARTNVQSTASPKVKTAVIEPAPEPPKPKPTTPVMQSDAPMTREQFKGRLTQSGGALADRPEVADRLFDRLDENKDGVLSTEESAKLKTLRGGDRSMPQRKPVPQQSRQQTSTSRSSTGAATKTPTVRIDSGLLVGEAKGDVHIFRGIPYAAPPVGELRWKPAQPPKPWQGVREALEFGAPAMQGETFFPRSAQSEDCLFLNVWTPSKVQPGERLPVLFWIHGGAFIQGSGAQPRYDGTELARRGVVVVTLNYRLGPLGLFAHPALTAEAAPADPLGNYCLLDMMEALRWVKRNIATLGGDPNNVTISGSSAGGTSCLFLMGIPAAQGLFHKALIHSSGGLRNILDRKQAEAAGVRLAEPLKVPASATATDLRKISAADLALSTGVLRQLGLPVKPIVDGRLVTGVVADTFAQGKQARIPVLMGAANGESGARQFGDEVATSGAFGFQLQLANHMVRDGQPVYLFQLTFVPPQARASRHAAMHGESVAYGFGTIGQSIASQYGFRNEQVTAKARPSHRGAAVCAMGAEDEDANPVEDSAEGRRISEAMMDYWAAFMRTGKPRAGKLPEWPPFSPSAPKAMVFGNSGIEAKGFRVR